MECSICCERFTKITRSAITCPRQACLFTACKTCIKTYFKGLTQNPHCMKCKYEFEDIFIIENINRTFFTSELKKNQTEILLQIEQSRIPQTQEQAKEFLYIENRNQIILDVRSKKIKLRNTYMKEVKELKQQFDLNWDKLNKSIPRRKREVSIEKTFIMRCQYDNCKGFLSTSYKCGICEQYTCSKCLECMHENECDPDKLETVKMIKRETRACPVCSTRIYKIEGCDQMWCTNCNNAFSWKTGLVQTGAIHNPHYFDFIKKQTGLQARNPHDIPCGGIPNNILHHTRRFASNTMLVIERNVFNIQRFCIHLENTRPHYPLNERLKDLRIQYMINRLPIEQWKKQIYRCHSLDKKNKFERDMYDILINVGGDLLRNYDKIASEMEDMEMLKDYVMNTLLKAFLEIIDYVNTIKRNKSHLYKHKARLVLLTYDQKTHVTDDSKIVHDYKIVNYSMSS